MGWARAQGTTGISGFAAPQGEGHGFDPAQGFEGMWLPTYLGSSLAAWYKADAGCYTDAACLFASASSQYLSKTSPTFAPTNKMTIAFDYKPTTTGAYHGLFGRYSGGTHQFIVYLLDSRQVQIQFFNTIEGNGACSTTSTLTAGTNYRIVIVYDGTLAAADRVAIYINGVADTVSPSTVPSYMDTTTVDLVIGGDSAGTYANGAMARVGLSALALSGAALTAAHTSTFWADMTAARQADWFSFYNLCEASGTRVDSTGLNNLTPTNGPTVAAGPGEGLAVNNSPVKRWEDQSGNARHLLQATIANQPLWIASGQNGRPILRTDGTNDYLKTAGFTLNQPEDVYAAAALTGAVRNYDYIFDGDADNGLAVVRDVAGVFAPYAGGFGPGVTPASATAFHTIRMLLNGASSITSIDGSADATTGNVGANNASGLTLAATGSIFTVSALDIGEAFIATAAVAAPSSPKAYLKQRWGTA